MQKLACENVTRSVKFLELRKIVNLGMEHSRFHPKKLVGVEKELVPLAEYTTGRA